MDGNGGPASAEARRNNERQKRNGLFVDAAAIGLAGAVIGATLWEAAEKDEKHGEIPAYIQESFELDDELKDEGVPVGTREAIVENQERSDEYFEWAKQFKAQNPNMPDERVQELWDQLMS